MLLKAHIITHQELLENQLVMKNFHKQIILKIKQHIIIEQMIHLVLIEIRVKEQLI